MSNVFMPTQAPQTAPHTEAAPREGTDLQLLQRVADGDRAAFHDLYAMYYHPVLHFIRRLTGRLDLAQEGVNDVMLVVWNSGGSFGGRSKVSTWIMGIAYRKAMKLLQRSRRWGARFKAAEIEDWVEHSSLATEVDERPDLRERLQRALATLSPEQRGVVELTYFGGYSYQEIATITACPVNTVKTRMFHARAKLRKLLATMDDNESLPCA